MSDFLRTILDVKRHELEEARRLRPVDRLKASIAEIGLPRGFARSLDSKGVAIIAEIKKASPLRGLLTEEFDHRQLAEDFAKGGAAALSVLTDEHFFQGNPRFIQDVKQRCQLPVLRKDFLLDEYQVYESRSLGADAVLLIVRILEEPKLRVLAELALSLGMDVLVEVHNEREVDAANRINARLIGVNNRDLDDFSVSLDRSLALVNRIHSRATKVSESGIRNRADLRRLQAAGFHAVLVGEGLMVKENRVKALQELSIN